MTVHSQIISLAHKAKCAISRSKFLRGKNLMFFFLNKIIGPPDKPIIIKTIHGFKMEIDPLIGKGLELSIFETGTYEIGTLTILEKLISTNHVVYDVGANIGLMTLFAAQLVGVDGKVYSFEPEPETFKILNNNITLNHLSNVHAFDLALGAKELEGQIHSNLNVNRGSASLIINKDETGCPVKIKSMDKLINQMELRTPHLIKIDVEGYELEVLKGAEELLKKSDAPMLCLEYSEETSSTYNVSEIYHFIKSVNKYYIYKFERWKGFECPLVKVNSLDEMPSNDNVFCFLDNHLKDIPKSVFAKSNSHT